MSDQDPKNLGEYSFSALESEIYRRRETRHYHGAKYMGATLTDRCAHCGLDLRNPIHIRETSCCGHNSDCAVHNAPALPIGPCDCERAEGRRAGVGEGE